MALFENALVVSQPVSAWNGKTKWHSSYPMDSAIE